MSFDEPHLIEQTGAIWDLFHFFYTRRFTDSPPMPNLTHIYKLSIDTLFVDISRLVYHWNAALPCICGAILREAPCC